jgi:hypothetical protein
MHNILEPEPTNFLLSGADEVAGRLVGSDAAAIQRAERDADCRLVEHGTKLLFALSQCLVDAFALGTLIRRNKARLSAQFLGRLLREFLALLRSNEFSRVLDHIYFPLNRNTDINSSVLLAARIRNLPIAVKLMTWMPTILQPARTM